MATPSRTDWGLFIQNQSEKAQKRRDMCFPHLCEILLAAIHHILWCQAVDHVAGVEDNQQEDHTEEEQSLGPSSLRSDFVQLEKKQERKTRQFIAYLQHQKRQHWSKDCAYPDPEEPNAHVANASHGRDNKVHGDDRDQDIIQWKNLWWSKDRSQLQLSPCRSHTPRCYCSQSQTLRLAASQGCLEPLMSNNHQYHLF